VKRVLFDTNLYVDWLNKGLHQELLVGPGLVRYLSAIVLMELRAGATARTANKVFDQLLRPYLKAQRLIAPSSKLYDEAGEILRELRGMGRDVRRAAIVHDILIALTARGLGASLYTRDRKDFSVIANLSGAHVELVETS